MTDFNATDRDVSRAIRSWLHEDRHEDASRLAGAVLDNVEATPRRRATWWPARRTEPMNRIVGLGLAAAAVIVALVVGMQLLSTPGGGTGGELTSSTTAEPTATPEPTPTPEPSHSPIAAPPLSASFTSTLHGFSMSYPEGWTAEAATEPWTADSTFPLFGMPQADFVFDPTLTDHLFLAIASQPIGDSTPEDWVAAQMASIGDECTPTEPIAVDGATGLIGAGGCDVVVVTTAGRGYWIQLHASRDDPPAVAPYDRAWFEEVLATVQLRPEDAVD